MRPYNLTQSGVGSTAAVKVDIKEDVMNIGFGCMVTGTVTYTVEHTFDEVDAPTPNTTIPTPVWFSHASVASKTVNADGNYAYPIRAFRLTVTAGTGSVRMVAIQSGNRG